MFILFTYYIVLSRTNKYTSIRHIDSREVLVYFNSWFGNNDSMTPYKDDMYPSPQLPPSFVLLERKKKFKKFNKKNLYLKVIEIDW